MGNQEIDLINNQYRMDAWINKKIIGYEEKGDTECAYPYPSRGIKKQEMQKGIILLVLLQNVIFYD